MTSLQGDEDLARSTGTVAEPYPSGKSRRRLRGRGSFGERSDGLQFFGHFLRRPLRTGAMLPSSAALAELIASDLSPETGAVAEFGGGTGAFTEAILKRGVPPTDLYVFEVSLSLAAILARRFPDVHVIPAAAEAAHLPAHGIRGGVGAVISGLPLLAMRPRRQLRILKRAFDLLRPDGCFYQFTYGLRCPVAREVLERLGLKAQRIGRTWYNWPPARVYRIERRQSTAAPEAITQDSG